LWCIEEQSMSYKRGGFSTPAHTVIKPQNVAVPPPVHVYQPTIPPRIGLYVPNWSGKACVGTADANKPKNKVIVRALPALLSEDQFRTSVEKYLPNVDFWYFVPGKQSDRKEVDSKAFMNFKNQDYMHEFIEQYLNHVFVTSLGRERKPLIEIAPFQKIPKPTKKKDIREDTIESDPDYLQFVEKLKEPVVLLPSAEEQLDKRIAQEKIQPTIVTIPLLEFLKAKKAQKINKRSDRAERRKRAKERDRTKEKEVKKPTIDESKKKKERGGRKKEREERRKKKKDTSQKEESTDGQDAQIDPSKKGEEDKKQKNGIWMIRKHLEPGAIIIQSRDGKEAATSPSSSPSLSPVPSEPITSGPSQRRNQQNASQNRKPNPNKRLSGKNEVKFYAPKQATSAPAAVPNEGTNQFRNYLE